jgi:hypothetical protein
MELPTASVNVPARQMRSAKLFDSVFIVILMIPTLRADAEPVDLCSASVMRLEVKRHLKIDTAV